MGTTTLWLACATWAAAARGARLPTPPPKLTPVGQSYASTDPDASAAFFEAVVRGAVRVAQNLSTRPACAAVAAVRLPLGLNASAGDAGSTLWFVDAKAPPFGGAVSVARVAAAEAAAMAAMNARAAAPKYVEWNDNHAGYYRAEAFDVRAIVARAPGFTYEADPAGRDTWPYEAVDVDVPHTTRNVQLWGDVSAYAAALAPYALPSDRGVRPALRTRRAVRLDRSSGGRRFWETCRNESKAAGSKPAHSLRDLFWWKATFASPDPAAALAFVEAAVGAVRVPSPFPERDTRGACTEARWALLQAGSAFMLHFVRSAESRRGASRALPPPAKKKEKKRYESAAWPLREWARDVARNRSDLAGADVLDGWASDRTVFWTDDLAGFRARLAALGAGVAVHERRSLPDGSGVAALVVTSAAAPEVVLEIRGVDARLAAEAPLFECLR